MQNEEGGPPLLERLTGRPVEQVVVIGAHPDDDVIGAGAHVGSWPKVRVVFVTDGSPMNPKYAQAAGFSGRAEYARARMAEAEAALKLAGVREPPLCLGFVDQEGPRKIEAISKAIGQFIAKERPDVIVTHPYEGGHPDHDAVCIAVHLACEMIRRDEGRARAIVEMTSYFARNGERVSCEFKHGGNGIAVLLTEGQSELKSRMYRAHASQLAMLGEFPLEQECFRLAPRYDFRQLPPGEILYAGLDMGISPQEFAELAAEAVDRVAGEGK